MQENFFSPFTPQIEKAIYLTYEIFLHMHDDFNR